MSAPSTDIANLGETLADAMADFHRKERDPEGGGP